MDGGFLNQPQQYQPLYKQHAWCRLLNLPQQYQPLYKQHAWWIT